LKGARRFLRSTALAILFASVLPFSAPDIFVYKSAYAAASSEIPSWINAACCGPADVHHLTPDQVDDRGEAYVVDGLAASIPKFVISEGHPAPAGNIHPSQDGSYWIFYHGPSCRIGDDKCGENQSYPYCFFVPWDF
jgi:hypothetical protein